jgi:hypothetical protein
LSNRDDPLESKTAAPVGAGSGGDKTGKLTSVSEVESYLTPPCAATAAVALPILTHFGLSIADQLRDLARKDEVIDALVDPALLLKGGRR